jgi:hypothetical protein
MLRATRRRVSASCARSYSRCRREQRLSPTPSFPRRTISATIAARPIRCLRVETITHLCGGSTARRAIGSAAMLVEFRWIQASLPALVAIARPRKCVIRFHRTACAALASAGRGNERWTAGAARSRKIARCHSDGSGSDGTALAQPTRSSGTLRATMGSCRGQVRERVAERGGQRGFRSTLPGVRPDLPRAAWSRSTFW